MPSEPLLRVGLVGCGSAGAAHALMVQQHPRTVLVACLDTRPARAEAVSHKYGGVLVDTLDQLLQTEPDLVVIATGPVSQPQVAAGLLELGFAGGLLCEKPLATSLRSGREMVRLAEASGATLAVNHQRRFGNAFGVARRLLREGLIGDLVRVEGHIAVGTLFDWAPHWIDMALLLADDAPVRWVHGMVDLRDRQWHAGIELEGHSLVVWEHTNQVRGQVECGAPVKGQPLLRVLGTDGVMELGAAPQRPGAKPRGPAFRTLSRAGSGWQQVDVGESILGARQWERSLDEVVQAMSERRTPVHDGRRSLVALEVCLGGYLAAASSAPVLLPLAEETDVRDVFDTPRASGKSHR